MLHTILRNTPFSLLVISILFSGILSIATAETTDRNVTSPSVGDEARVETKINVNSARFTEEMDAKRKVFQARAAEMRTNVEVRKEAMTTRIKERRARISEKVENRVRTVITNMQFRGNTAIKKLESIADRIESRAHTIEARGVNINASLALVAQARIELRAAGVIINENIAAETDAAVTAEKPQTAFEYVKESMRETHEHIKAAQKALRDAVSALKEALAAEKLEARATTTDR